MEYDVDICRLSPAFYAHYPKTQFPEIMIKGARPYTCLLIETRYDYFICIPFRSSIRHDVAFLFSGTQRSEKTRSGLDYKKTVLIRDRSFIDSSRSVIVDNDEYTEVMRHLDTIVSEINAYIQAYVEHINGVKVLHPREFIRQYQFSTLPYFHDILFPES